MDQQVEQSTENQDLKKNVLDKRLDSIGWALFLIMIGGLWLAPEGTVPEGTWLIGTGIIILGLMAVRYLNGIRLSGFWLVLGIAALAFGISSVFGLNIPVLPILIIIIGLNIILKPLIQKK
ncbi:MAG: hypothetical protein PVI66_12990 [Candidatus Aminicenantes bacterium]|jgi:hypothetical protein